MNNITTLPCSVYKKPPVKLNFIQDITKVFSDRSVIRTVHDRFIGFKNQEPLPNIQDKMPELID
jgi:hypothetical protein